MSQKRTIIKGTFILTGAGILSRIMGFFYRIFLSRRFGANGVGLYQLIFPVYTLIYALTAAGIQTAISQKIGALSAENNKEEMKSIVFSGLLLSVSFSVLCMIFLQKNSFYIANYIIKEPRCEKMLLILSYVFPFSAIHSCISGYYYGQKKTTLPALSQLLEQVVRISVVIFLSYYFTLQGNTVTISFAVIGLIFGEISSSLCSILVFANAHSFYKKYQASKLLSLSSNLKTLLSLSVPLTLNRVLLTLFQSFEAISIPNQLKKITLNTETALAIYGVLTGMAIPCIMFPSAITSSIAVLMVPTIAEMQSDANTQSIRKVVEKVSLSCICLGLGCCFFFLCFGRFLGTLLFQSELAGDFLCTLSWICPFLYLNTALISTINGTGNTLYTLLFQILSLSLRMIGVFVGIPKFGIQGYLYGLLISQLTLTFLCLAYLQNFFRQNAST